MTTRLCAGEAACAAGDALLPPVTRRHFFTWGLTAAIAATLPPVAAAHGAVERESWLRRGSYAGRVGETFQAVLENGRTVSLRLVVVDDLIGTSPTGKSLAGHETSFLLELQGPDKPRLPQGVHELRHPAFGRGMLFLVPQAPASNGSRYAMVVNRQVR